MRTSSAADARIGSPVFTEADTTFRYELEPEGSRVLVQRPGTSTWWREALLVQAWQRRDLPARER